MPLQNWQKIPTAVETRNSHDDCKCKVSSYFATQTPSRQAQKAHGQRVKENKQTGRSIPQAAFLYSIFLMQFRCSKRCNFANSLSICHPAKCSPNFKKFYLFFEKRKNKLHFSFLLYANKLFT